MPEKVLIDEFTIRLNEVIGEIVKRDAMPRKGKFSSEVLKIPISNLNKIEKFLRNFPVDKQAEAKRNLNLVLGISEKYWSDPRPFKLRVKDMFEFEPAKRRISGQRMVSYQTYKSALEEIEQLKKKLAEVRYQCGIAAEEDKLYLPNPDQQP